MEANDFVMKLKADNTEKDNYDLRKMTDEYKMNLNKLSAKDRGPISLNVLRTLCWNLDKAPWWQDRIDKQALLALTIDCVRETRPLDRASRVKTLACIFHLHKYAVALSTPVAPELVLKISFMPFELDSKHLLQEYHKTYWNILVDRLFYMERLKSQANIFKLLPKLTDDISKVIEIYDTVQFCSTILVFLVKKLYYLYNERHAKELSQTFTQIFIDLSKKDDLQLFKRLTERETLDLYVKLNDCFYVIAENATKINFKDCMLDRIVRTCILFVGHTPALFHCLQTFYQNSFCFILSENTDITYTETVIGSLQQSLETTEKLGYKTAAYITYPYLSQLLRLYVEYNITNATQSQTKLFNVHLQENCLKLILFFMKKLNKCEQLLKCENCHVKSGLHDSIRLSLLIKHFLTVSLSQNVSIKNILEVIYTIITEQYIVLTELNKRGCVNHQKLFRKLQTDVHNTAISMNKAQYFESSIKLFDIYLKHELECTEIDYKNISRALFNKSICEMDCKLYENALIDAFLSLIFSREDGLNTDKYMSLVMDIKAKELKSKSDDEDVQTDTLQLVSVLNACKMSLERNMYGDLMMFMSELKFSVLLKHEFSMYAKLWPSIAPIGGVWRSLLDLSRGELDWVSVEQEETVLGVLYEVILETPSVVRTVHSDHFSTIVRELLDNFDRTSNVSVDRKLVHAALLFLQSEYELAAASQKYGWKFTEPLKSMDPDQVPANRTIPQEHAATKPAIVGVLMLANLLPNIEQATSTILRLSLHLYGVFVPLLLHLCRDVQGLQLAYVCCRIALLLGDDESYLVNAGTLLSAAPPSAALSRVTSRAGRSAAAHGGEAALVFLCDAAIHLSACGGTGAAARLVRAAQARILRALQLKLELNLDVGVGRVLEAQAQVSGRGCSGPGAAPGGAPGALSAANAPQRHYLATSATGSTKWSLRRLRSLTLRLRTSVSSLGACRLARSLRVRARARAAAAAALAAETAPRRALLYSEITDVASFDDALIKIDNRLKHALGLQPSNEIQPYYAPETTKQPPFTPKQDIETMLDNMVLRKSQTSPSQPCVSVPAFKIPDFFNHTMKCTCYACDIPLTLILACKTSGLEAAMYARANENEIARNYFNGVLNMMTITERRLKEIGKKYKKDYEHFVVDSVIGDYESEFRKCFLDVLIELSFFELKCKNYDLADEYIVKIHETVQEVGNVDQYVSNEILNLMIASAQLRKIVKKPNDIDLAEFENLRLSPLKFSEPPKTPVTKPMKPPQPATKIIVKDEELPKKRKVIKLNLEDDDEKDFEKPTRSLTRGAKKEEFKIPNPITSKPVLEIATPRRRIPVVMLTQPSQDMATPKILVKAKDEFYTPAEATPEQFFTPMTSVKTYSKKSLRQNIVKNLEREFTTPEAGQSVDKENERSENLVVKEKNTSSKRNGTKNDSVSKDTSNSTHKSKVKKEAKKALVRAVSPGKLTKEKERDSGIKPRRLRTQVNFSVDEDEK